MVKQEWKNIFHNTWMKVVIVAIIAIPSIYACVFLGSMWDPYGNSGKIPVAIVNEDQTVTYEGQRLAVGEELVKNLKDNDSMGFQFVNTTEAMKGLEDGDYYMVVTIPDNFSKNATTLLNDQPQKMILNYTTNPGTNYIASKMDDSAIAKIKSEVSSSVTKTYAETIFSQIDVLSQGLGDASEGTGKISDGVNQLADGNQTISDHLKVLASRSLTFQDGATTLTKGLKDYTEGIVTIHDGVYTLKNGLDTLKTSTGALANAITKLDEGAKSLQSGIQSYTDGVQQVSSGSDELTQGVQQVSNNLKASLSQENITKLDTAKNANDLAVGSTQVLGQLLASSETAPIAKQWLVGPLSEGESVVIPDSLKAYAIKFSYPQLIQQVSSGNKEAITTLENGVKELNTAVHGGTLSNGTKTAGLLAGSQQIKAGLSKLNKNSSSLTLGSQQLSQGTTSLVQQTPVLIKGIEALDSGAGTLYQGTTELASHNPTLLNGSSALSNGAIQISSGADQLATGSTSLGSGLNEVKSGVSTLDTSLKEGAQESKITTNENTFEMVAAPVDTSHKEISTVENNGHAMAPYMMSVALYVAGLAFTLMYPVLEGAKEAESGWKYWLSKATIMFTISTLAAIVMITCLRLINGFEPQQMLQTYMFAILVSAGFMAIILLLNVTTGYIGEFLLLVFMIINLGGSAGTYPLETSSGFFQAIHNFVPYTYSVNGFRKVISMSQASISTEVLVFICILIGCSILTILYYHFKQNKNKHLIPQAFEKHE